MPAVGFRILEVKVPEARAWIFTCVQIFSPANQPLPTEVEVEFYTQDGSAKGIITSLTAPDDYEMLVKTLTCRRGTLANFVFDAECVALTMLYLRRLRPCHLTSTLLTPV